MKPYKGKITTYGSIAPLIELGAGFDQNLTARENIYLNGAVLGYSKQFMQVLSVVDAKFKKKCNQRMEEMLSNNTTLLYVSHNIKSVMKLCTHAIWIEKGNVMLKGEV